MGDLVRFPTDREPEPPRPFAAGTVSRFRRKRQRAMPAEFCQHCPIEAHCDKQTLTCARYRDGLPPWLARRLKKRRR